MKLDFNFGEKTLLKDWWKQIKENFTLVQEVVNSHITEFENAKTEIDNTITERVAEEKQNRISADDELLEKINDEKKERGEAENSLDMRIREEVTKRAKADTDLNTLIEKEKEIRQSGDENVLKKISDEITARCAVTDELSARIDSETESIKAENTSIKSDISALRKNTHSHLNKATLDKITTDKIALWDGIGEQVTHKELSEYGKYTVKQLEYARYELDLLNELLFGENTFDCGFFDWEFTGECKDGGTFDAECEFGEDFDGGVFEAAAVIVDGGVW